jgi:hypothetical protein
MDDRSAPSVIAGYRAATACSDALREANLRATLERARAPQPAADPAPIPRTHGRRWLVAGAVAAAAMLVAWLAGDALVGDATTQPPAAKDAAQHDATTDPAQGEARPRSTARGSDDAPAELPAATRIASAAPPSSPPPRPRPASAPAAVSEPAPAAADASDATAREAALLHDARRALDDGATEDARALLDRHGREFPRGALAQERWMLQVRADCSLDVARARATAAAFRAAFPGAAAAARLVDDPCPRKKP